MSEINPDNRPRVSVVMPAYNASQTIAASIHSVLTQTYDRLELLIVNDGSIDKTTEEVARYLSDKRLRYFENESNKGVAETRNLGIREASGDYIAFCDSDDRWLPEKLAAQLAAMRSHNVPICGTNCLRISEDGSETATSYDGYMTFNDMLVRNYIVNSSGIYDLRVLDKHYQRQIHHEDYDMWLRLFEKADAVVLPGNLVKYRVAPDSLSGNKVKSILWHINVQIKNRVPAHVILISFLRNVISRLNV